jgi:hypothetical protein
MTYIPLLTQLLIHQAPMVKQQGINSSLPGMLFKHVNNFLESSKKQNGCKETFNQLYTSTGNTPNMSNKLIICNFDYLSTLDIANLIKAHVDRELVIFNLVLCKTFTTMKKMFM